MGRSHSVDRKIAAFGNDSEKSLYNFPTNLSTANTPATIPGSAVPTAINRIASDLSKNRNLTGENPQV